MINEIKGNTQLYMPENAPHKKSKEQNDLISGSNHVAAKDNTVTSTAVYAQAEAQENQYTDANSEEKKQVESTVSDYVKEAMSSLQSNIRKEYINKNYYIDDIVDVQVMQLINMNTDHLIGQYPSERDRKSVV